MIARLSHHLPRGAYLQQLARGLVLGKVSYAIGAVAAPRLEGDTSPPVTSCKAPQFAINDVARSILGKKRTDTLVDNGIAMWNKLREANVELSLGMWSTPKVPLIKVTPIAFDDRTQFPSSSIAKTTIIDMSQSARSRGIKRQESQDREHFRSPVDREDTRPEKIEAFSHRLNANWCQILQIILMSLTLAPLRLACFFIVLFLAYFVSLIGLIGVSEGDLIKGPLTGWRGQLQGLCYCLGRAMYFTIGLHWIKVKGEQANPWEAPVLAVAPHATFVDTIAIVKSLGTPVAKDDFQKFPILGVIAKFVQVLFVKRENPQSRKLALQEIRAHTHEIMKSEPGFPTWRQLLVFPEGTCTSGKALIYFKVGAFQNSVPVQPVTLRFPNRLDTLTWTWDQKYGSLGCFWLTLCQLHTRAEIEFLPVQFPSDKDDQDPRVFAQKIRQVMAEALEIPEVDLRLEDGKHIMRSRDALNVIVDEEVILDPLKLGYNYVDFAGNLGLGM
eukprot:snap_masked-scaffold85_size395806-processed-gene-2.2 protein:Tk03929 transcript:snap_masked-scaffold85_size395806-processed-gene-2.2-mRNA-1 annotation:"1-acylglycerophosphocholine o-acyltransferase 1-like isoform x1"